MKISTAFTSFSLKLVGGIILISSLVDYISLAIPFNWQEDEWQINFTTQIVDRGIVPMLAVVLLLVGWWLSDNASSGEQRTSSAMRLPVFIIASILGLIFLLLVPLHLSNISRASANALTQINQQVGEQEGRIETFIEQLNNISQNPQQIRQEIARRNQAIETGQVGNRQLTEQELQVLRNQREQLQQLLDLSQKPAELKQRLQEIQERLQTQLRDLKLQQQNRAKTIALKQSLRTGVNSLMLAIGYIVIGWLGLKNVGSTKTASRKA
jgi:ABC-type multidrug transport system fused ATPase/permease subunit